MTHSFSINFSALFMKSNGYCVYDADKCSHTHDINFALRFRHTGKNKQYLSLNTQLQQLFSCIQLSEKQATSIQK